MSSRPALTATYTNGVVPPCCNKKDIPALFHTVGQRTAGHRLGQGKMMVNAWLCVCYLAAARQRSTNDKLPQYFLVSKCCCGFQGVLPRCLAEQGTWE